MRDDDQHTADQYDDHMQRIDQIRHQFTRGQITVTDKRRQIADENAYYYGPDYKSAATGERIAKTPRVRDEVSALLADVTGAPIEAVRVAMTRRRELCAAALEADTRAEGSQLLAESRTTFDQIMRTAIPRRPS